MDAYSKYDGQGGDEQEQELIHDAIDAARELYGRVDAITGDYHCNLMCEEAREAIRSTFDSELLFFCDTVLSGECLEGKFDDYKDTYWYGVVKDIKNTLQQEVFKCFERIGIIMHDAWHWSIRVD